jgi:hypothetical protein
LQQERSADPLLFIAHYVEQVAASGKLPLELGGNIHLFRQRWWKSTFIPALLTPPPHGGSLPLAHIKLGELLVDRGMLVAQQVCIPKGFCVCIYAAMLVTVTIAQWDDFLVRVRHLSQDHKQLPPAAPAAAALQALASSGSSRAGAPFCSLSILRSSHAQLHEMQVTRVVLPAPLPYPDDYPQALEAACSNDADLSERACVFTLAAFAAGDALAATREWWRSSCVRRHAAAGKYPASCICAIRQRLSRMYSVLCCSSVSTGRHALANLPLRTRPPVRCSLSFRPLPP